MQSFLFTSHYIIVIYYKYMVIIMNNKKNTFFNCEYFSCYNSLTYAYYSASVGGTGSTNTETSFNSYADVNTLAVYDNVLKIIRT